MFKNKYWQFFLALLTSLALCLDKKVIYEKTGDGLAFFRFDFLMMAFLSLLLFWFYRKYGKGKLHPLKQCLAGLFAVFIVFGNSYEQVGSWNLIFSTIPLIIISCFQVFCYYFLFYHIFLVLDHLLEKGIKSTCSVKKNGLVGRYLTLFKKHPFLISLVTIIILWSFYMIAFYPLILSRDPSFQIKQFFNVPTKYIDYVIPLDVNVNLTNHHPVLHTLLLGSFIKIGRFMGSDNLGLFLYGIVQALILAVALSSTVHYLYKRKGNLKSCIILLLIYGIVPFFPLYAMSAVKDTIYTALLIFYVLFLLELVERKREDKLSFKGLYFLFLLILLMALFRNNGLYVIVLSFPFLLFYRRKELGRFSLVFLLFLGCFFCYDKVLLPHFKIPAGSKREALSLPFQQTARYVKEHGQEVTPTERMAIDKVLGYDDLGQRYNPVLADPVKNAYNKYTTSSELKEYFKVWFSQLQKHPGSYLEATLHNTYGYFYPGTTNWYIYYRYNALITEDNLVDYHYNSLSPLRSILSGFGLIFPYLPVFGLLCNIGFNGWLLLLSCVYLWSHRKKKYLLALSPLLVSFLICFASPANTYFRYSMPYVFAMPFVISYLYHLLAIDNSGLKKKGDNGIIKTEE